jgi:medium-chain acyl-[acyl-carrier-protein] hydrolase
MTPNKWFVVLRRVPRPAMRLFCFPFAGGGARAFQTWPEYLPRDVELWVAQLPGREGRFKEAAYTRLTDLVADLVGAIAPHTDVPHALFGHSMGALVAFTLARELRRAGLREPELLMVSGRRAPQRPDPDPPIHALPEKEFLDEIRELNGTPEAILRNEELLQLLIPLLRADFAVCETYEYVSDAPLDCPIVAFGGTEDPDVSQEDLAAWSEQTTSSSSHQMFPGDHFYLLDGIASLLKEISRHLDRIPASGRTTALGRHA